MTETVTDNPLTITRQSIPAAGLRGLLVGLLGFDAADHIRSVSIAYDCIRVELYAQNSGGMRFMRGDDAAVDVINFPIDWSTP